MLSPLRDCYKDQVWLVSQLLVEIHSLKLFLIENKGTRRRRRRGRRKRRRRRRRGRGGGGGGGGDPGRGRGGGGDKHLGLH